MPMYRVVERIYREHYVEANDKWDARAKISNGETDGGEDYDWEVIEIEETEEEDI